MSNDFLIDEKLSNPDSESYSKKRLKLLSSREKAKPLPLKELEAEKRETALATYLPEDNKGFQMLLKLGFKKGQALGKQNDNSPLIDTQYSNKLENSFSSMTPSTTISSSDLILKNKPKETGPLIEPIKVFVKTGKCKIDRLGLGHSISTSSSRKRPLNEKTNPESDIEFQKKALDYRSVHQDRFSENQLLKDVRTARRMCQTLDENKELPRSELWHPETEEDADEFGLTK
ncbi:hypothetical protein HK096_009877, partial [Nowakowskiella sp. JEL0078]